MSKTTETFYAARVSESNGKLVRDDYAISLFADPVHIADGRVEAPSRPFKVCHPLDFHGRSPEGDEVVKVTVTTETV